MNAAAPVPAPPALGSDTLLQVQDLRVAFRVEAVGGSVRRVAAVGTAEAGVSFTVARQRTVALVGESGSGKTASAMAVAGLLPPNAECSGRVLWQGRDLLQAAPAERRALRGRAIACVFQDPMSALNPVLRVGDQVAEVLRLHQGLGRRAAAERCAALFDEVGLPEPRRRLASYPHELSGGQQQRVMIAMALAGEPQLLIADEPTTALDVTIQRQILDLLARLKEARRMSLLFISHDLGVVGEIADDVVVLRQGRVREAAPVARLFSAPADAYTRALLDCRPSLERRARRLRTIDDAESAPCASPSPAPSAQPAAATPAAGETAADPGTEPPVVLRVESLAKSFLVRSGVFARREFKAVQGVSFELRRGRTLGVVGESGSGKSTLGLALLRLHEPRSGPQSGRIWFDGADLMAEGTPGAEAARTLRRRIQIVFQNPYAALNPRFSIGQTLLEPLRIHAIGAGDADRQQRALALLQQVGLDGSAFGKYPHEFSGGQRQRIAIARSLALEPEVLVLDEAVSALDVSVQAQVLNLLKDLQAALGLAYVFISHDLAVVRHMADEVLVMKDGQVVERAAADDLLARPREDYTRRLLAAVPRGWRAAAGTHPQDAP